jgi:hypothetical protein
MELFTSADVGDTQRFLWAIRYTDVNVLNILSASDLYRYRSYVETFRKL